MVTKLTKQEQLQEEEFVNEREICDEIHGKTSGYIKGLGFGARPSRVCSRSTLERTNEMQELITVLQPKLTTQEEKLTAQEEKLIEQERKPAVSVLGIVSIVYRQQDSRLLYDPQLSLFPNQHILHIHH